MWILLFYWLHCSFQITSVDNIAIDFNNFRNSSIGHVRPAENSGLQLWKSQTKLWCTAYIKLCKWHPDSGGDHEKCWRWSRCWRFSCVRIGEYFIVVSNNLAAVTDFGIALALYVRLVGRFYFQIRSDFDIWPAKASACQSISSILRPLWPDYTHISWILSAACYGIG